MMAEMIGQHMGLTSAERDHSYTGSAGEWAEVDSSCGKMVGDCRIL